MEGIGLEGGVGLTGSVGTGNDLLKGSGEVGLKGSTVDLLIGDEGTEETLVEILFWSEVFIEDDKDFSGLLDGEGVELDSEGPVNSF